MEKWKRMKLMHLKNCFDNDSFPRCLVSGFLNITLHFTEMVEDTRKQELIASKLKLVANPLIFMPHNHRPRIAMRKIRYSAKLEN